MNNYKKFAAKFWGVELMIIALANIFYYWMANNQEPGIVRVQDKNDAIYNSERLRDIVQFQIVAYNFIQCIFSFENAVDLGNQNIDIIRLTDVIIRADLQAF